MTLPPTYVAGFHDEHAVRSLSYKKLGQTDMIVSSIGLGGVCYGGHYQPFEEKEALDTFKYCLQQGVNFIDTAPWYGNGKSEEVIGRALKGIPREAYYLATKVGHYGQKKHWSISQDGWSGAEVFNYTADCVLKNFDESLKKLNVDYVDLIQVHDFEFSDSFDVIVNETLPALDKLRKMGKVKYIGINTYEVGRFKELIELAKPFKIDTVFTYCRHGLINNDFDKHVTYIRSQGLGIINGGSTGLGLLTERGAEKWHVAQKVPQLVEKLAEIRKRYADRGVSLANLAVKHATNANNVVDTTFVSMPVAEIAKTNLQLATSPWTAEMKQIVQDVMNEIAQLPQTEWEKEQLAPWFK